jgi:polar amino acid transport system ATP-binding protein
MTMIIVTHEISFARKIAHRVIFMDHGLIVEQGPTAEVLKSPRTPRLQQFLKNVEDR